MRVRRLAVLALLGAAPAAAQAREMAVTFDDLPVISRVNRTLPFQQRVTRRLLDGIRSSGVPATGFVNENKLAPAGIPDPARVALLDQWLRAGLELGNHTYSHPDLHDTSLADFEADVLRGERVLRPLVARRGGRLRYFRHPFLHTGRGLDTRRGLERFLAEHGYRIAPVTIDDHDFVFAVAYDRAVARGDTVGQRRVATAYLDYMLRVVAYWEGQSQALLGRNVRHVMLLHANALNGDHFAELARRLRRRGYAFVPLDRALEDPAYRSPDRYAGPRGISWIHRWAITEGRGRTFFAGEPEVPVWVRVAAL